MSKVKIGFSYARVSTQKQDKNGVSIEAQHTYNLTYADKLGVEIKRQFSERGKTGRNFNRPEINALKRAAKSEIKKGHEVNIFFYDTSRLGRDVLGNEQFRRELQALGANVYISSENQNISNDDTFFMFGVKSLLAEQQSRDNGRRTSSGMRQVYEMGFLPLARLPFGYDKIKIGNRKTGKINDDGFLLQKIYLEYLEKSVNKSVLWHKYLPKMKKPTFYELFLEHRLIFYSGRIPIPMNKNYEKIVEGKHRGILTIEQCERLIKIQEIEASKTNDNKSYFTNDEYQSIYWLKGLLWHEGTNKPYTSCPTSKPRKNEIRHYYRPQKGKGASLPVEKAHAVMMSALKELRLSDERYATLKKEVEKQIKIELKETHRQLKNHKKDLSNLQDKLSTLEENFDRYTPPIYERLFNSLDGKIKQIESKIKNCNKLIENVDDTMLQVIDVMRSVSNIVDVADVDYKQNIVEAIFGTRINIDLKNRVVRTAYFNPIIASMCCKSEDYKHIFLVDDGILTENLSRGTKTDDLQTIPTEYHVKILNLMIAA